MSHNEAGHAVDHAQADWSTVARCNAQALAGTAAMTVSHDRGEAPRPRLQRRAREGNREGVGIKEFEDARAKARFSDLSPWGYGTGWGIARAVMREFGLGPKLATPAHFAAIWGSAAVMLPALEIAPPFVFWGKEDVAIDLFHHAVYAAATGLAYELLD